MLIKLYNTLDQNVYHDVPVIDRRLQLKLDSFASGCCEVNYSGV